MRNFVLTIASGIVLLAGVTGCNAAGFTSSAMQPLDNFGGVLKKSTSSAPSAVQPMDNFGGVLKKAPKPTASTSSKTFDNFGGVL